MSEAEDQLRKLATQLDEIASALDKLRELHQPGSSTSTEARTQAAAAAIDSAHAKLYSVKALLRTLQSDHAALQTKFEHTQRQSWEDKVKRAEATARLQQRDRLLEQIQSSPLWKIVKPIWKFGRRSGRGDATSAPPSDDVLFAIEAPVEWKTSRETLLIKGWCFSAGGRQIAGVRAKIGRKGPLARYGLERPDLARSFSKWPAARNSGFTVDLRVPRGKSTMRLECIVQGGDWQPFFEHELFREGSDDGADEDLLTERVHRARKIESKPIARFPEMRADKVVKLLAPLFEQHSKRLGSGAPVISVLTPTFNTKPAWFAEAAVSILNQSFDDWEWVIVDDGSSDREIKKLLKELSGASPRLKIKFSDNKGISAATNEALDLAAGEYICFLDHDDLLDPIALLGVTEKLRADLDVVYSDEDKLNDATGELVEHFFKPDWSPEYFRGAMYVGHLLGLRRELATKVRFDPSFDGVQDFEFMLRVSETGARIGHFAGVLYHWRKVPGSVADKSDAKPQVGALQQRAVDVHLQRLKLPAHAEPAKFPHRLRIVPNPRKTFPKISIIIPTKDAADLLGRCLESIYSKTSYPDFEVVLIDNQTTDAEALRLMEKYPVRRVLFLGRFNFSRANNLGVREAAGEFVVFLNNDTEVVSPDWLQSLLYYAEQPDVGAAGALLVFDDQTVQHAGVLLGMRGTADHVMRGFPMGVDGYAGSLACAREVSAVTGACMMISKARFDEVNGFNEHYFTIYQDTDLCLRLRERGLRIICTPEAVVVHHESVSRRTYYDMVDRMLLLDQWEPLIERGDPYYNPNLNVERGDYSYRH